MIDMTIKIVTLVENSMGENLSLKNEHGLSILIESDNYKVLFDTGQSDKFLKNAGMLNIDMNDVTHVVLSHGHYDHSGGFRQLTGAIGNDFRLFVTPEFFNKKYAYKDRSWQYLGSNFDQSYLEKQNIEVCYMNGDVQQIAPNLFAVKNFEKVSGFEKINERFYVCSDGEYSIDDFSDEIALVIKSTKGLVVLLGCSHPGVVNILDTIVKRFEQPIYAVLGGTHLVDADQDRIDRTINYLKELNVPLLGISHCTGQRAVEDLLEQEIPFFVNSTGSSIVIEE